MHVNCQSCALYIHCLCGSPWLTFNIPEIHFFTCFVHAVILEKGHVGSPNSVYTGLAVGSPRITMSHFLWLHRFSFLHYTLCKKQMWLDCEIFTQIPHTKFSGKIKYGFYRLSIKGRIQIMHGTMIIVYLRGLAGLPHCMTENKKTVLAPEI